MHLTLSNEAILGTCPTCATATWTVLASPCWDVAFTDTEVEVKIEISGHWCPKCRRLQSLSVNGFEGVADE